MRQPFPEMQGTVSLICYRIVPIKSTCHEPLHLDWPTCKLRPIQSQRHGQKNVLMPVKDELQFVYSPGSQDEHGHADAVAILSLSRGHL